MYDKHTFETRLKNEQIHVYNTHENRYGIKSSFFVSKTFLLLPEHIRVFFYQSIVFQCESTLQHGFLALITYCFALIALYPIEKPAVTR